MTEIQIGDLAKLKNSGQYAPTFRIVARTAGGDLIGKDTDLPKSEPLVAPKEEWEKVK